MENRGGKLGRIRVNLTADFNDRGGWGRHARGFAAALDCYVELAACGTNDALSPGHMPDGDVTLKASRQPLPDAIGVALGAVTCLPSTIGSPRIFYTVWESSQVPELHVRLFDSADMIWVPTEWGRQIFARAGLKEQKLRVVPEGVDANIFHPLPATPNKKSVFRFLCVGKWERRKGTADLVRAFASEFTPSEPVELVMHCHNIYLPGFDLKAAIASELAAVGGAAPRITVSNHATLPGLIKLMQRSDAFVLPTRGEAWGLPILEAMACGLPCIVTDCTGHRTFANESNSYLISVAGSCPAYDPIFYDENLDWGEWCEPDTHHLQSLMRHVFENREEAKEKGRAARRDAVRWSWDNAGRIALKHLREMSA